MIDDARLTRRGGVSFDSGAVASGVFNLGSETGKNSCRSPAGVIVAASRCPLQARPPHPTPPRGAPSVWETPAACICAVYCSG